MKLSTYISARVSTKDGEIYIDASRYAAFPGSSNFDIGEMEFEIPEAAIVASEAIKNDTGDIEKQIAELEKLLEARRASK